MKIIFAGTPDFAKDHLEIVWAQGMKLFVF